MHTCHIHIQNRTHIQPLPGLALRISLVVRVGEHRCAQTGAYITPFAALPIEALTALILIALNTAFIIGRTLLSKTAGPTAVVTELVARDAITV